MLIAILLGLLSGVFLAAWAELHRIADALWFANEQRAKAFARAALADTDTGGTT